MGLGTWSKDLGFESLVGIVSLSFSAFVLETQSWLRYSSSPQIFFVWVDHD